MTDVVFVLLCERCLLKLPDPVHRRRAIREAGGLRGFSRCPRCGPIDRIRLLPCERKELQGKSRKSCSEAGGGK